MQEETKILKTTKYDFEVFKEAATKWQYVLGLTNWHLFFDYARLDDAYANTAWNLDGTVATLTFSTYWDDLRPKTEKEIDILALHEVLHVLFAPFVHEAQERYTEGGRIGSIEHDIIRRLEKVLYGQKEDGGPVSPKS